MSPHELGTGSNVLGGGGTRLPMGGNTDCGQRDSGYLAVSTSAWVAGLIKPAQSPDAVLETRLWANHGVRVYANQRLSFGEEGKGLWRKSQDFKPDRGNPAVRHYRGASENVTLVEMCSHLATERAGMGTLHLTVGASEFYPDRRFPPLEWRLALHREGVLESLG
jgi:hypothetical protein